MRSEGSSRLIEKHGRYRKQLQDAGASGRTQELLDALASIPLTTIR